MSRLLLDTHAFIWWREDNPRLSATARQAIEGAAVVFVSLASAWEVAIKRSLGRLTLPESFEAGIRASGFDRLPIGFGHIDATVDLPRHHNDPFDRMLIAQALIEHLSVVTHDRQFEPYGIDIVRT